MTLVFCQTHFSPLLFHHYNLFNYMLPYQTMFVSRAMQYHLRIRMIQQCRTFISITHPNQLVGHSIKKGSRAVASQFHNKHPHHPSSSLFHSNTRTYSTIPLLPLIILIFYDKLFSLWLCSFFLSSSLLFFSKIGLANNKTVPIIFIDPMGKEIEVDAQVGKHLLDVAHDHNIELEGTYISWLSIWTPFYYIMI